jgi:hypothetical protein
MPFMDAYIPEGALSQTAERELIGKLSDLLIEHEGVDPANETVQRMTWVSVHRPEVYVGGGPTRSPRYRFICQVPEGQYDDERRLAISAGITKAVAEAEDGAYPMPEARVSVFPLEVRTGPGERWEGSSACRTSTRLPGHRGRTWLASRARRPSGCSPSGGERRAKRSLPPPASRPRSNRPHEGECGEHRSGRAPAACSIDHARLRRLHRRLSSRDRARSGENGRGMGARTAGGGPGGDAGDAAAPVVRARRATGVDRG